MPKHHFWDEKKKKRFYQFAFIHKKYLTKYFEEKLKNPIRNSPIKSGFFNLMADYIDYDKHCCRTYFHNHKMEIFVEKFKRSRDEYARFCLYLKTKKKKISKKKERSKDSKDAQRIKRKFNKELHGQSEHLLFYSQNSSFFNANPNPLPLQNVQPPHIKCNIPNPNRDQIANSNSQLPPQNPLSLSPVQYPVNPQTTSHLWEKQNLHSHISVQDQSQEIKSLLLISSNRRLDSKSSLSQRKFETSEIISRSRCREKEMVLGSMQWETNSIRNASFLLSNINGMDSQKGSLNSGRILPLEDLRASESDPKNQRSCHWKIHSNSGSHVALKSAKKEEEEEIQENDYTFRQKNLLNKIRFKSYMDRIRVSPEIFESLKNIRFCLACCHPVLKGINKNDFIVKGRASIPQKKSSFESKPEVNLFQVKKEQSLFVSDDSLSVVSKSNSENGKCNSVISFKSEIGENFLNCIQSKIQGDFSEVEGNLIYQKSCFESKDLNKNILTTKQEKKIDQEIKECKKNNFSNIQTMDVETNNKTTIVKKDDLNSKSEECFLKLENPNLEKENLNKNLIEEQLDQLETNSLMDEMLHLKKEIPIDSDCELDKLKFLLNQIQTETISKYFFH